VTKLPAIGEEIEVPTEPLAPRAPAALPAIGEEVEAPVLALAPAPEPPAADADERLRAVFQLGMQINPTEAAGVNYIARQLDLPPGLVAQQYPAFRVAAESVGFDPARFRREHPAMVDVLLNNPQSGLHPKQAEQISGFTRVVRAVGIGLDYADSFEPLPGGSIEELRASAMEQATAREAAGTPLPEAPDPFPALKQVPTRQSELKGRTGVDVTAAILAAEGRRGLLANELGDVGFALLVAHQVGENTDLLRRRQIEIEQELGVQVDYGQNAVEQLLIDAEQGVMSQAQTLKAGGKGYAVGAAIGTAAGLGATRNPKQATKFGHAVGLIFGKAGFSYGSFKQESGTAFAQLLDEKLDDGTPLDRDVAAGAAFLYGVAAAAVELVAFGELAKSLGPLKTMIAKGEGRAAIRAWAADRSKREILKAIGKQWAKSAASEAIEEGTQTTLQHAITWAGKSFAAGAPQKFDVEAWATETAESIYLGGLAGGAMAAPGSAAHAGARLQRLTASRGRGEVVAALAKLAGTEAALASPQAVAELVTREAARAGAGPIHAAYLDVEAAETFFQTQGTDAGTALSELLGQDVRAQVAAAKAGENLGRLEIPLATYLEKLGPTGVAEALAGDTAVRAFDATLNEQSRDQRATWAEADAAVQLWQKTGKTPDPEPGEIEWAAQIAKQAAESGAATKGDAKRAQLVARAFVRTLSKRYGEPVRALMGRYAVDVRPAEKMPDLAEGQAAIPQPGATAAPAVDPALELELRAAEAELAAARAAPDAEGAGGVRVGDASARVEKIRQAVQAARPAAAAPAPDLGDAQALQASQGGKEQGFTRFYRVARKGLNQLFQIATTPDRDASTLLHESAHVFLEIFGDIAELKDAPASAKDEYSRILAWLGVASREEIKREHHEKWAGAFETYLYEGKTPSLRLASVFAKMRAWFLRVGQKLKASGVPLNDEIRGLFDRMLATDEDLAAIRAQFELGGEADIFPSAEAAGLTPEQYDEYLAGKERAFDGRRIRIQQRILAEQQAATEGAIRAAGKAARQQAEREFDDLPAARAMRFLRDGDVFGNPALKALLEEAGGKLKLDRQAVVDAVGADVAEETFRGLTAKDADTMPDQVAEAFGFASGETMLKAIVGLPERGGWVQTRADQLVAEQHPTLLSDRARLAEAVADAAHATGDLEYYLRQWQLLRTKAGDGGLPPVAALERAAAGIVRGKVSGRLNLKLALDAEAGAARRAAEAAASGNWRQAAVLMQQQLLNHFIYRELMEAKRERDELERMAKTMTPDKYRGEIGRVSIAIRDAIDQVLEATALRERIKRDVAPRPISEAVQAMQSFGTSVMLDQAFLEDLVAHPRPHGELLVENMRKVLEALKNLRAAALSQQEVIDGDRKRSREDAIGELEIEAAATTPHLPEAVEDVAKSAAEHVSSFAANVHGEVLRIGTMVRWLGGRDTGSAWYRLIMEPLQRAKHREVELLNGPFKKVIAAFEKMPAGVRRRLHQKVDGRTLFPTHRADLRPPTHRFQLLMMALNAGNDSNRQRLLEGRGVSEQQLDRALSTLTRAELDWVQEVWDACESLWPLSRELEERDAGVAPPKIPARMMTVMSSDGHEVTLRGGYFPAVYVRDVSTAGEKQSLQAVADILSPGFTRPGTPHSHLKGRAEDFADAIATDPAVIMRHLTHVAHDVAFREALKSVASILMDERIQTVLKRRLGAERAPQFLQWLKDIGAMRAAENAAGAHGLVKGARRLRSNTAIGILGYAADVALGDLTNLGVAVVATELKAKWWARGMAEFAAHPLRSIRWTGKASGELAFRRTKQGEELRRHIDGMAARSPFKRGALERFKRFAFVFMEASDLMTSTPIWMGAYHQALAQGRTEQEAVTFADDLMRRVFPSHSAVDASAMVRRKDALEFFMMFHGYANVLANLYLDKAHQIHEAKTRGKTFQKTVEFIAFSLALGTVASVAADFIMGHGPTDDDEDDEITAEEKAEWFVERLLLGWAYPAPVFGVAGEMTVSAFKGKRPSARSAPIYSGLEGIGRAVQKAIKANENEDLSEEQVIELLKSFGLLAGVPAVRPARVAQGVADLSQGEVEETQPNDIAALLLYGERAGLNPFQPTEK
jgi:hypothetical protein